MSGRLLQPPPWPRHSSRLQQQLQPPVWCFLLCLCPSFPPPHRDAWRRMANDSSRGVKEPLPQTGEKLIQTNLKVKSFGQSVNLSFPFNHKQGKGWYIALHRCSPKHLLFSYGCFFFTSLKQMNLTSFERSFGRLFCLHFTCGKRWAAGWLQLFVSFIAPSLGNALFISVRDTANKLFSHRVNSVFPRLRQISTN